MGPQGGLQLLVRAVHRVAVDGGGDRVELLPGSQATVSSDVNSKDNQISPQKIAKNCADRPHSGLHSDKVHAGFLVERIELVRLSNLDRQTIGMVQSSLTALGSFTSLRILNNT